MRIGYDDMYAPLVDNLALRLELVLELLTVVLDHLRALLLEELAEAFLLTVELVLRLHLELHERLHALARLLVERRLQPLRLSRLDFVNAARELRQVNLRGVEDIARLVGCRWVGVQVRREVINYSGKLRDDGLGSTEF